MNAAEAGHVLAYLTAAWPNASVEQPTAAVWIDHLRDVPYGQGMRAAHNLVASSKWFPTVVEFRDAWRIVRRADLPLYALPAPERPSERAGEWLEASREELGRHQLAVRPRELEVRVRTPNEHKRPAGNGATEPSETARL